MLLGDLISNAKISLVGGVALLFSLLSAYAGYALNDKDPAVVCSAYIQRVDLLVAQARQAEQQVAEDRLKVLSECAEREADMCAAKMAEVKKRLMSLRCRICEMSSEP